MTWNNETLLVILFVHYLVGVSFFMSEPNSDCSENNAEALRSPDECHYAMTVLNENNHMIEYKELIRDGSFPKGCIINTVNSSMNAYWNRHSFGSKNPNSRQICTLNGNFALK